MTTTETKAAADYRKQFAVTTQLLDELVAALPLHYPGEGVNYGHVGDLQHVNARLREVLAFMTGDDGSDAS